MRKNMAAITAALILIASSITAVVFNTRFAKVTIDAWSFFASLFLMIEGSVRIAASNDKFWPLQASRFLRVIIGACVFTIHACQVIYGI